MTEIDKNTILHCEEIREKYCAIRALLKEVSELLNETVVGFEYNPGISATTVTYLKK